MHPSTAAILRHFEYAHLPVALREASVPFYRLANSLAATYDGPELTTALRKLLEAKDCAVRAAVTQLQTNDTKEQ